MSRQMSVSNKPSRSYRGKLKRTHELEQFFKILDEWTIKGYENQPYNQRKYYNGWQQAISKAFDGVDPKTIWSRIRDHPNGMKKIERRGESSAKAQAWQETACYEAIKNFSECFDAKKDELTAKGKKYESDLKRVWQISKTDPLDLDFEGWLQFWGKPPKSRHTAHPIFTDSMTGRVRFSAAVSFRLAMLKSHNAAIRDLIISKDGNFTTDKLKRPKGLHKDEYQNEQQVKALPKYIQSSEVLMLDYVGVIFGGRFDALKELTPADLKPQFGLIHFYEGKVNLDVDKRLYDEEARFIQRYITDKRLARNQKLFPRSISYYNAELTKAGVAMGRAEPDLKFLTNKGEEWFLTTHRGFKHTCVTLMGLHGVRRDTISDYIGTDEATLKEFYQGGTDVNIDVEIGGLDRKTQAPTWRAFIKEVTMIFEARYNQLVALERGR